LFALNTPRDCSATFSGGEDDNQPAWMWWKPIPHHAASFWSCLLKGTSSALKKMVLHLVAIVQKALALVDGLV
jgi:hypothetical protein